MDTSAPINLKKDLEQFIPTERVFHERIKRIAFSVDASMFSREASIVVDLVNEKEVAALLKYAKNTGTDVTFRGGGTSLNGQCSGHGILARLRGPQWQQLEVSEDRESFKAWCNVLGLKINNTLAPFKKMLGPDPASLASATFGGIVVNNAAGMCCTVEQNAYATLESMRLMLTDGTVLDTSESKSVENFRKSHKELLDGILQLRNEILEEPELASRISKKYEIKNTCGYSMNSFVDFEDPVEILTHLMIGSEGTLGFVSNASLQTFETFSHRATALIFFRNLATGAKAVTHWSQSQAATAAELFDGPTLKALANLPAAPALVKELDTSACAVLIEARANSEQSLHEKISLLENAITDIKTLNSYEFYTDENHCEALWAFRRAMFPAVAGNREPNQLVLLEDVCFPLDKIEEGCEKFAKLFDKYDYEGGVHGHAFHGNFHFALPVNMSSKEERTKIHAFLEEMMHMVVGLNGSLKAEHGTGYAVAPFVELEWGKQLYGIMKRVKTLLDPEGILNPGVLINDDPHCHTKNLKNPMASHAKIDNCVECGFCESICPSKDIGLTPRQRVALWRNISRMKHESAEDIREWEKAYDQLGTDLCATDGLCTTRCPLQVDVAGFVKDRRKQIGSTLAKSIARRVGNNFAVTTRGASHLLNGVALFQRLLGDAMMYKGAKVAEKVIGKGLPSWNEHMPRGGAKSPNLFGKSGDTIVYMPSCAIRTMGDSVHDPSEPLQEVTIRVLERAGYTVTLPESINTLCCGKAFDTKGLFEEAQAKSNELESALLKASDNGKHLIFCETSPCLAHMRKMMDQRLKMFEPVEFTTKYLIDRLVIKKLQKRIAIHPTCSTRLLGLAESFANLAERCATEVVWPKEIQCCGFSGDKGFSHPELNKSSLQNLCEEIQGCDRGYSTSRTCEIGLSLHGKVPYQNIMFLLDSCTS